MTLHHPAEILQDQNNYQLLNPEKLSMVSITPELIRTSDKVKSYNIQKCKCYLKGEKDLKYFQIYTESNCELACFTNFTLSKCGCLDFYMLRMNGSEFICNLGHKECILEAEDFFFQKGTESKEANSSTAKYYFGCNCLPLCTELKYNLDVSQADFKKIYPHRMSRLGIYFKSSSFSVLERNELYGTTDLISNFGGLLGLFTGFSFISLAEIVYFLTLRIWCNRRRYGRWSGPPV